MESFSASNLICTQCKLAFNLKSREPIYLICCRQTACRECVQKMNANENKNIVKKGYFDCSFCHADHCTPKDVDQPIELSPNEYLKQFIS